MICAVLGMILITRCTFGFCSPLFLCTSTTETESCETLFHTNIMEIEKYKLSRVYDDIIIFLQLLCVFFRETSAQKSRTFISFCLYWSHLTELAEGALFLTYRKFQIVNINFVMYRHFCQWLIKIWKAQL